MVDIIQDFVKTVRCSFEVWVISQWEVNEKGGRGQLVVRRKTEPPDNMNKVYYRSTLYTETQTK